MTHSAASSAAGYQYQADFCLLTLLREPGDGRSVGLEMYDDVHWEDDGTPTELLQVKHRVSAVGGLGDHADALWRTLQVWMDEARPADPDGPMLCLASSGTSNRGSAAYYMRPETRDVEAALALLRAAAGDETKTGNLVPRQNFARLTDRVQLNLVRRIRVLDAQPVILDIEAEVRKLLWLQLPDTQTKSDDFIDRLFGWWRRRAVEMLTYRYFPDRALRARVSSADLRAELHRLTISYSRHGLPEFDDLDVAAEDEALAGLESEIFVQQLHMIKTKPIMLRKAIVDYYRAFHSETRWLDGDYLHSDDVQRYEAILLDAWETAFVTMVNLLPDNADDDDCVLAGKQLLAKVLNKTPIRIRDQVDQSFYYRGKQHMLAQQGALGWHPEFEDKVKDLLLNRQAAS